MCELVPTERLERLVDAGWSDVCDRILAGLCHDLNGRVTALAGMVQLLQLDDDPDSMAPYLEQEVGRLEGTVLLVRRLTGEPDEAPEALHLPEILPELVELFGKHRFLESIETTFTADADLLPVVSRWTLLSRCFLLLLSLGGQAAMGRERRLSVHIAAGDDGLARMRARAGGALNDSATLPPLAAREEGMAAMAALIEASWHSEESQEEQLFEIAVPMMGRKPS